MDFSHFPAKLYESFSIFSDTPWYYPTALVVIVIGIILCLFEILNQFCSYLKEKGHRIEKPKLFDIPDKKNLGELTGEKNNAQKLMDKIYLPKSKEQILEIMEKVGANKMFVKGGKGAISGELCTKEDIDETSKSQSTESDHNISGVVKEENNEKTGKNNDLIKKNTKMSKEKTEKKLNNKEMLKGGVKKMNNGKTGENKKMIKEKAKMSKGKTDKNIDQFKKKAKGIGENEEIVKEKAKVSKAKTEEEKVKSIVKDKKNGKAGENKEKEKVKLSKEKTEKEKGVVKDMKNGKAGENKETIKEKTKMSKEQNIDQVKEKKREKAKDTKKDKAEK